jgi:hypothetical protein
VSNIELCGLCLVNILDGKEDYKESQAPCQGARSEDQGQGNLP